MQLRHKKYQGFTLLEMVLVLSISCLLVLLPVLHIKRWQEHLHSAYFFQEFERTIIGMQQSAIVGRTAVTIRTSAQGRGVFCQYSNSQGELVEEELTLPEHVTILKTTEIKFIAKTGNLSKIDRFEFADDYSDQRVIYQYQIGSGRFVKKTSKL